MTSCNRVTWQWRPVRSPRGQKSNPSTNRPGTNCSDDSDVANGGVEFRGTLKFGGMFHYLFDGALISQERTIISALVFLQQVAFKNIVERNRTLQRSQGPPPANSAIHLPYIIVNTSKKTVIDCSISNDKYVSVPTRQST